MSQFGVPTETPPRRVDELISSELMAKLNQVDVFSKKIFAGKLQGERRSKKRGQSVEFADYRHYTHGDDLRFVDWNIFARLDKLFIKMFLEEEDLSLVIAIDSSKSMHWGNPSKFIYAQKLAMALGYIGLVNQNRVSLFSFNSGGLLPLTNLRGGRRVQEMGAWLLKLEAEGGSGFDDAMRSISMTRQGKGVMLILSDFLFKEGYEKGLRYLAGGGYDTFCMQLLSPEEIDPGAAGLQGDLRLTDIEDDDVAEVTVSGALLKKYKDNLNAYCGKLREFCVRRGMMHMTIDSKTDLNVLLMDYLRKRGLLR
ncbi:MAG: DUF58 domain-containing protein [Phycisphaerales bacterium]|nr:MAG: DUF58 domain-containing protein [Phycisphaerales bacterium]